uniref:Uncharacterized protein n=1 Tax=Anguilla anguilla TaxID=7936 RepID=A0A0E9X1W9_ANGAN
MNTLLLTCFYSHLHIYMPLASLFTMASPVLKLRSSPDGETPVLLFYFYFSPDTSFLFDDCATTVCRGA